MDIRKKLEERLGKTRAEQMCESPASARSFLSDPEPEVRCAALSAMADLWEPDQPFKDTCEEMALNDPSPEVRKCAIASLFIYYRGIDDARLGKVAALLAYDNSQPNDLRHYAYQLLFPLYRPLRPAIGYPISPRSEKFRFPEDVDWKLVDSFLYPPSKPP